MYTVITTTGMDIPVGNTPAMRKNMVVTEITYSNTKGLEML